MKRCKGEAKKRRQLIPAKKWAENMGDLGLGGGEVICNFLWGVGGEFLKIKTRITRGQVIFTSENFIPLFKQLPFS